MRVFFQRLLAPGQGLLPVFFFALFLSLFQNTQAADIHLFKKDGKPSDDYSRQLNLAKDGDFFVFPNGKKIKMKKFIGRGNTTNIFQVEVEGKSYALRLPKLDAADDVLRSEDEILSFIDDTIDGYKTLNGAGLPTVKIHDAHKGQYILVDYVKPAFTLDQFLKNPALLSEEDWLLARTKLMEFAKKSAPFSNIGDFRFDQMAFDKEKNEWVLLDWMHSPDPKHKFDPTHTSFADHIFNQNYQGPFRTNPGSKDWSKQVLQEIDREIRKERLRLNEAACSTRFESLK